MVKVKTFTECSNCPEFKFFYREFIRWFTECLEKITSKLLVVIQQILYHLRTSNQMIFKVLRGCILIFYILSILAQIQRKVYWKTQKASFEAMKFHYFHWNCIARGFIRLTWDLIKILQDYRWEWQEEDHWLMFKLKWETKREV